MRRADFDLRSQMGSVAVLRDAVPTEPGLLQLVTEYNKYVLRRIAALVGI
jgi:hypothetical protein